jgi:hypothetical protein
MPRLARLALRAVVLATLVIALVMVLAPSPGSDSPYLSALSLAALGDPALAAKCPNRECVPGKCSEPGILKGYFCSFATGFCATTPCREHGPK